MTNSYSEFLEKERYTIFLFHGVIGENKHSIRNYTNKHLTKDRFVSVLNDLSNSGEPVSFPDIVNAHQSGNSLPDNAFAITFDDGFINNFTYAAPELKKLNIPATFYITTDFVDNNSVSWIDRIEYAVESKDNVTLSGLPNGFNGNYETAAEKIELLNHIRQVVKNSDNIHPEDFADLIWNELGITKMIADMDLDEKLKWTHIEELDTDPLFTIGGHGKTHRILTHLNPDELENEISVSCEAITPHLSGPLTHYSYPEGMQGCYSDSVIQALQNAGIVCSPTAEPCTNAVGDDLFRLKRVMVS